MSNRINVALVISDLHAGGAERLLVDLVAEWRQQDAPITPHVYALADGPIRGELEAQGCVVSASPVPNRMNPLVVPWLARAFFKDRMHVAHLHLPRAAFYGRLAATLSCLPVLYTEHNLWEIYHPVSRFLNQSTYFLNSHVATVSDAVLTSVRRHSRYSPAKLTRVYNGIAQSHGMPRAQQRRSILKALDIPDEAPIVGTIANLHPRKGLKFLLYATERLLAEFPNLHWLVIGRDDGEGEVLNSLIAQRNLECHVHVLGYQKHARHFLSAFDVFVLPSLVEGLPVALIEAMDAGLAIVATRVGGNPELIQHEQSGLLVEPEDVSELYTAIRSLLLDPVRRTQMGQAGQRRMKTEFTIESMAKQYAVLYQTLASRRPVKDNTCQ